MKMQILYKPDHLSLEFGECCRRYDRLEMAVAWCGDPEKILPYEHLRHFRGKIFATIGTSFHHTHPNAIQWLKDQNAEVRIFRDDGTLFHPKLYLFTKGNLYSLFVGSSNLTYSGFYANVEASVLINGQLAENNSEQIESLRYQLVQWRSEQFSFKPSSAWLRKYRTEHSIAVKKSEEYRLRTESSIEIEIGNASWLRNGSWDLYYRTVIKGISRLEKEFDLKETGLIYCNKVLDAGARLLSLPWKESYFSDIEKRRIINGIEPYGWLGHVGASGSFLHLVANGNSKKHRIIIRCINTIGTMNPPLPWQQFKSSLDELISLGPTMKVWGRLLCLVRPDLFCTVASTSVRTNLSKVLKSPQSSFVEVEGYVNLIRLIHASPWFNSPRPKTKEEMTIWTRRVAFMDAIFY